MIKNDTAAKFCLTAVFFVYAGFNARLHSNVKLHSNNNLYAFPVIAFGVNSTAVKRNNGFGNGKTYSGAAC